MKFTGRKVLVLVLLLAMAFSSLLPLVLQQPAITYAESTPYYSGDYYDGVNISLTGRDMYDELAELITDTHTTYTSYSGLKDAFKKTDLASDGSGKIVWFYTGTEVSFSSFGSGGGSTNREHVWPKNGGNAFPEETGPGSDAHHLRPTEANLNSSRGNLSFDEVTQNTNNIVAEGGKTSYGNSAYGADALCYKSGSFFYPAKGYRGATARILLYMYVRWGEQYNLTFVDSAGSNKTIGKISTLLKWHYEEPPTDDEIRRNEAVFKIQGNRNPFIDHPEWATTILCDDTSTTYYQKLQTIADQYDQYNGTVAPETLSFADTQIGMIKDQTKQLTLTATPSGASTDATWTSDDTSVVTVSNKGVVTAVGAGTATITATSTLVSTVKATITITVKEASSISVSGTPAKTAYMSGQEFDPTGLTVTVTYSDGTTATVPNADCQWLDGTMGTETLVEGSTTVYCVYGVLLADEEIAVTVEKSTVVEKTVTITRDSFTSASSSYAFQNYEKDGVTLSAFFYGGTSGKIQLNSSKASYYIHGTVPGAITSVTVKLAEGSKKWELRTSATAYSNVSKYPTTGTSHGEKTVTTSGVTWDLTGNTDGNFTLNYLDTGVVYIKEIVIVYNEAVDSENPPVDPPVVEPSKPTAVTLDKTTLDLTVGGTSTLIATVTPSDALQTVTWASSNEAVAKVVNGVVTAIGTGTATITATSTEDISVSKSITVTVTEQSTDPVDPPVDDEITLTGKLTTTFKDKDLGVTESDGLKFTTTATVNSFASGRGVQFLQKNGEAVLTSTSVVKGVTNISVVVYTNQSKGMQVGVSVGGVALTSNGKTTVDVAKGESTTITFFASQALDGKIEIKLINTANADSMYISQVIANDDVTPPVEPTKPTAITPCKTQVDLEIGNTENITLAFAPDGADQTVTWKSSDESVATIENGKITAVKAGSATITITSAVDTSISATVTVNVQPQKPTSITVSKTEINLIVGDSDTITVTVAPTEAVATVNWATSNEAVATVSNGKITAVGKGTATVTVTSTVDANVTATVKVTVGEPATETGITVSGTATKLTYTAGESFAPAGLTVTLNYSDGTKQNLSLDSCKWLAGDTNGTVLSTGMTYVTCVYNDFEQKYEGITVNAPNPTEITLSKTTLELEVNCTAPITVTVKPTDAVATVTWESNNERVATVVDGVITAVAKGTATITVTSAVDTSVTAIVTVVVTEEEITPVQTGITISGSATKLAYIEGDKFEATGLTVTLNFSDGTTQNVALTDCLWLDGETNAETLSAGTTTVICKYTGENDEIFECIVDGLTVTAKQTQPPVDPPVEDTQKPTSITPNKTEINLIVGESETITVTVAPTDAVATVNWATSNEAVATVSNGKITAVGKGTATITVTSTEDEKVFATITVKVQLPVIATSIEVSGSANKVAYTEGDKFDATGLIVTLNFSDGAKQNVALTDCLWLDGETNEATLSVGTTTVICRYVGQNDVVFEATVDGIVVAEKQVEPPVIDVSAFTNAVAQIETATTLNAKFDAIAGALAIYDGYDQEHKTASADSYAQLLQHIQAYNQQVEERNAVIDGGLTLLIASVSLGVVAVAMLVLAKKRS